MSLREVATIEVALAGAVVAEPDDAMAFGVVFPSDVRAERAANAYLLDLADMFARPLTLRSYGYDILRWLRFLAAVNVAFDEAVRSDYTDFRRWLIAHGKTGGSRRPRAAARDGRRLNAITGKTAPHDSQFDPATIRHSRVVLHEWYEFLRDRGWKPLVNPIPSSDRRDRDGRPPPCASQPAGAVPSRHRPAGRSTQTGDDASPSHRRAVRGSVGRS